MHKLIICCGCKQTLPAGAPACEHCKKKNRRSKPAASSWYALFWLGAIGVLIYLKATDAPVLSVIQSVFWNIIGVIVVGVAGFFLWIVSTSRRRKTEALLSQINSLPDFNSTKQFIGVNGMSGLAVDEPRCKICLISFDGILIVVRVVSYREILSAELFEDGGSVTKVSRSSQLGGALIGGLVFGRAGAIIGGLSGKRETSARIRTIDLRLLVNDTDAPLHDVAFLNLEVAKDGMIYKDKNKVARSWLGIVNILIQRADAEDKTSNVGIREARPSIANDSVADEIGKLAELVKSGALTADEFKHQKAHLLAARPSAA